MKYGTIQDIISLTVLGIYGSKKRKNSASIEPEYIVFDNGKTYIVLDEQDYYSYHDCSPGAREIAVMHDEEFWDKLVNTSAYGQATEDL